METVGNQVMETEVKTDSSADLTASRKENRSLNKHLKVLRKNFSDAMGLFAEKQAEIILLEKKLVGYVALRRAARRVVKLFLEIDLEQSPELRLAVLNLKQKVDKEAPDVEILVMLSIGDIIYDSTNPNAIPITARGILYYLDGANTSVTNAWKSAIGPGGRLQDVDTKIGISVLGASSNGLELDVERYDAEPADAAPWSKRRFANGVPFAVIYCNRSNMGEIEGRLDAAGISPSSVGLHVSTLDGTKFVQSAKYRVVAVQYTDTGSMDESVITAHWPGVTEEEMLSKVVRNGTTRTVGDVTPQSIWAILPNYKRVALSPDQWQAYQQIGSTPFEQDVAPEYIAEFPLEIDIAATLRSISYTVVALQGAVIQLQGHSDPAVLQVAQSIKTELDKMEKAFQSA